MIHQQAHNRSGQSDARLDKNCDAFRVVMSLRVFQRAASLEVVRVITPSIRVQVRVKRKMEFNAWRLVRVLARVVDIAVADGKRFSLAANGLQRTLVQRLARRQKWTSREIESPLVEPCSRRVDRRSRCKSGDNIPARSCVSIRRGTSRCNRRNETRSLLRLFQIKLQLMEKH